VLGLGANNTESVDESENHCKNETEMKGVTRRNNGRIKTMCTNKDRVIQVFGVAGGKQKEENNKSGIDIANAKNYERARRGAKSALRNEDGVRKEE